MRSSHKGLALERQLRPFSARRLTFFTGVSLFGVGVVAPILMRTTHRTVEEAAQLDRPISVVITAYREAGIIGDTVARLCEQLKNAAEVDARIIVVASDHETADAAEAAGATTLRVPREGKARALNRGVEAATGKLVVLTDANASLGDGWPARVREGLKHAHLISGVKHETGGAEQAFWQLERLIKSSKVSSASRVESLSVVGELLAFRSEDFAPFERDHLSDDLALAASFDRRGKRVLIDRALVALEPATTGVAQWERRIRIAEGQYREVLPRLRDYVATPAGRTYLVHKMYRLTVGVFGFWLAILSLLVARSPWSMVVVPLLVGGSVAHYTRAPGRGGQLLTTLSTAVSLQVVPIVSLSRLFRSRNRAKEPGWKKVAR
ncbi:glycosyltransferase [Microbacterium sp. NPDC006705]|uniref:glycosyltransferase n=1 Tax=Microbacterium sp. NPDC006705 TaxID=3364181 RepID=UPI00384E9AE4